MVLKLSAPPLLFCVALSQFYIAALSIIFFLDLVSGYLALKEV